MSLTVKVFLTLAVVIGVALTTAVLLIGGSTSRAYQGYMSGNIRRQLAAMAEQTAGVYAESLSWPAAQAYLDASLTTEVSAGWRGRRGQQPGRGAMVGGLGRMLIVDPSNGEPLGDPQAEAAGEYLAAAEPVVVDGQVVALLAAVGNHAMLGPAEQRLLDEVQTAIFLSAIAAGIIALLVGGLLVVSILRPLRRLEAGVERIGAGDLGARVEVSGRDEIGRLAARFNAMAAHLEQQETLRQRMVADIAHELRTPLSVVQGNLQAILDGVYPLEIGEVETVYEETRLLSRLVADLHDLAQAEAGRLSLIRQPVNLGAALEQMAAGFRSLARQEDVDLQVEVEAPDLAVDVDPDRLHQILNNLIGNAVRHTPQGGRVTLRAAAQPYWARVSIADTGPGIPPESQPHVFDRFYRVDDARARDDQHTVGAGLGLAIVKALVEAHGGSVGVESHPAQGTTFWFQLPRPAAREAAST